MIGFFDSGIGGLTVLEEFRKRYPAYDYAYFGDRANCPYGDKQDEEIVDLTEKGVAKLFDDGAEIVVLACNTATVHAIRYLQQVRFPDRKILGVTIP
ncbi:MAG: glutamate racemase, partial [Patescibacteria group bacterium]